MGLCRTVIVLVVSAAILARISVEHAYWKTFPELPAELRPYRPVAIALLNDYYKGYKTPSFEPEAIIEDAKRVTGIHDLLDDNNKSFMTGLTKLTQSIESDARLTYFGRQTIRRLVDLSVRNRLKVVGFGSTLKTSSDKEIAPIFITGMPRSGTTFLHNLLSQDTNNFRFLQMWELVEPDPQGLANHPIQRALRILKNEMEIAGFRFLAPNLAAVHPLSATNAEECIPLLGLSMISSYFSILCDVPSYLEWMWKQNQTKAMAWHQKFLHMMNSGVDDGDRRKWLLKAPAHMNHLQSIFDVYPKATVIVSHRDPNGMLASLASLHARFFGFVSDDIDLKAIGRNQFQVWEATVSRFIRDRKQIKSNPALFSRIFDLSHDSWMSGKDPIVAVRKIYDFLKLKLTLDVEEKMRDWLANDLKLGKKGANGKHEYKAEWFGLNQSLINSSAAFVEYMQEYIQ